MFCSHTYLFLHDLFPYSAVEGALHLLPIVTPALVSLLDNLSHIKGVHLWHLYIDDLHMEDVITVSREAYVVGLCACHMLHGTQSLTQW